MAQLPDWEVIERDIKIGLVVMADACRYLMGFGTERGETVAAALLGIKSVPQEHLDDLIEDESFFNSIKADETDFFVSTQNCYRFNTSLTPLDKVEVEEMRIEGRDWLSYFLSSMPSEAMGGGDYSGLFHSPDAPLVLLRDLTTARVDLAEYVQNFLQFGKSSLILSPREIALLGDVDIRTVRNAMGPKGNKPIQTELLYAGARSDMVYGKPLDVIEWLAGRRGFRSGGLSVSWVEGNFEHIKSLDVACALPGLLAWLNDQTSDQLATRLEWNVATVRDWTRAKSITQSQSQIIAEAVGLDGDKYASLIARLTA